jgi:hypothetical protein
MIVFALKQGTTVRFTVVRVYPSCERVGSFKVRGHKGVNRVRFRGRLGGRALAGGTYRLVAQARGQEAATATVTIVVARGKASPAQLARARRLNTCSTAEASEIEATIGVSSAGGRDPAAGKKKQSLADPVVTAAKSAAKKAKGLAAGVAAVVEDSPFTDPLVLLIVGLFLLAISALGTMMLYQVVKGMSLRDEQSPLSE